MSETKRLKIEPGAQFTIVKTPEGGPITVISGFEMFLVDEERLRAALVPLTLASSEPENAEAEEPASAFYERLGDDATKWADELWKVAAGTDLDQEAMVGWFANAIEASHALRIKRLKANLSDDHVCMALGALRSVRDDKHALIELLRVMYQFVDHVLGIEPLPEVE